MSLSALRACAKAGMNLADEDVSVVLDNFDSYSKTMGEEEATVLAVDDALESAKQERDETREAILKAHPDLIPKEPEPEVVVEPVEAPVDPNIAKEAKKQAEALALRAPQEDETYNLFASHAANVAGQKVIRTVWSEDMKVQAGDFIQRKPTQPKTPPTLGLPVGEVWNVIRRWQERMPHLAKVTVSVFETQDEAFGRGSVERDGVIQGGFFVGSNEMVLIGRNIRDAKELMSVMRHELIGHFGMRELLNKEGRYDQLLQRVWDARKGEFKKEAQWVKNNYKDLARRAERRGDWKDISDFADEVIARATETKQKPVGLLKRIHDQIIKWLNQLGLSNGPITQEELASLIRSSEQNLTQRMVVKEGGPKNDEVARIEYDMYLEFEEGVPLSFKEWNARMGEQSEYARAVAKGLPMDFESRMERAREMGYDTSKVWYHGTPKLQRPLVEVAPDVWVDDFTQEPSDFDRFELDYKGINRNFISISSSPEFASEFTGLGPFSLNIGMNLAGASRIIPLLAKTEKTFDYESMTEAEKTSLETFAEMGMDEGTYISPVSSADLVGSVADGNWTNIEGSLVQDWLREEGYDSFYANEGGNKTLAVLDPSQLRSVNAAFDPESGGRSEMLARSNMLARRLDDESISEAAGLAPAIRTERGMVHAGTIGQMHNTVRKQQFSQKGKRMPDDAEMGFVTPDGKFLDRRQAFTYAEKKLGVGRMVIRETGWKRAEGQYLLGEDMLARRGSGEETDIEAGSDLDTYRKAEEKRPIVGVVSEPIRNKDGEYRRNGAGDITGAPEGVKTQQAIDNIVIQNMVRMESQAAQMPISAEWYNIGGAAIRDITRGDPALTEQVVRTAALLSAANQVGGNTTGFIKAAYQIANGEEAASGRFPNKIKAAMPSVLAAKDMNFNLPQVDSKVMSFYRNLWDATFQSSKYEGAVTMDVWMARLYGYKGDTFGPAQYRFASMVTKDLAKAYNAKHNTDLTPDQVQAALWVYQRNTQAFEEKGTPIPTDQTNIGFETYIDRATQQLVFEAAPSTDSGLFPELHDMSFDLREDYTRQAVGLILNEGGENELFNRIGIPLYTSTPSEGSFIGVTNPNEIMGGLAKGGGQPDTELLGLAARAIAYIYTQDGVPVFQFDHTLTGGRRGVSIRFPSMPTLEMEEGFLAWVRERVGADFTRIGNDMIFLNLKGEMGNNKDEFFSGLNDKKFIEAIDEAYRSYEGVGSELFKNAEIKTDVKATSQYIETDWASPKEARAGIEDFFSESGRSDLLPFLRDRREAVGRLQESFAKGVTPPFDVSQMAARRNDSDPPSDAQDASDLPVGTNLGMPDEDLTDKFVRLAQDSFNRVKTLQTAIVEQGGTVELKSDVYGAEERSSSKITSRLKQLKRNYMDRLLEIMDGKNESKKKIAMADLDLYLIAKHANERNEYVASINPNMQDGGSGMMTDEADSILADFDSEGKTARLEEAAAVIYELSNENLDNMVDAGLIEQEVVDSWRDRWAYYVPLKGKEGEEQRAGTGKGFSVSGAGIQKVMGRGTGNMPESPVAHAFGDAESTIVRAEKTTVGQALIELVRANPDPNFWTITERTYKKLEDLYGQPFDGYTEEPVGLIKNVDYHRVWGVTPAESKAAKAEGRPAQKQVYWALDRGYKNRDDVFSVMVEGKELLVNIEDEILMEQLKKMNTTQLNAVVRGFGMVNRYLAMINTALNPEFVITNFERDFSTAMINLGGEHSAGVAARVAKGLPSAIRGIWQSTFDTSGTSPWRALFDEMEAEGGTIGFFGLEDIDTKVKKIQKKLEKRDTILGVTTRGIEAIRDVVLDANLSVENAARLSAYKVIKEEAIANGMNEADARAKAASVAKNLTVNFNRKGELAPVMNSAYLFFNATVQGSARIFTAMKSPRVRKIVAGVAATSFALALYNRGAGGDDDDGIPHWDKLSEYKKQTSMIIMKPDGSGEYWSIRLPYGYNAFWYSGVAMNDLMFDARKSGPRVAMNMVTTVLNAFNPIQGADFLDTITPTFLKPFEQHAQNVNFMGSKIKPEYPFDNYDRPDSQKAFKSTNPQLKEMMSYLNEFTGGDTTHSGLIDFSPEIVKHYVSWLSGGAGMFGTRTLSTVTNLAQGEPVDVRNVPFARQVTGKVGGRFDTERFYDAVKDINAVEAGLKQRLGTKDWKGYQQKWKETHKLSLQMKGIKKVVKRLRDQRDAAYTAEDTDKANEIREEIRQHMMKFSLAFEAAQTTDLENQ